ncbi:nitrogen permease regulator of amino acid transport activity 3-domain-containing protein [Coniella lustricola]|uniref:Nitrogen permease regulator 3 n=1 Tax=Coniella lustricola TaxID=2025994 RepID=A0A2T3AIQ9_9PEZI|nr:nitrogen permease regulator of amino acid transport activity 3-domain-containing protein [Coniella lustricola]
MALPILPNSSNFLGVALVINRNRDGPRFVFHYPPHIVPVADRLRDEDEDGAGADEDDLFLEKSVAPADGLTPYNLNVADLLSWDQDDHLITESGTQLVPWEHVAGFPTKDLESILTPARAYHKTLFQISLDPLYFVSYPIHKPESGMWKKRSKRRQDAPKQGSGDTSRRDEEHISPTTEEVDASTTTTGHDGDAHASSELDTTDARDMADKLLPDSKQPLAPEEISEDRASNLTMFNLVFILNPKQHEAKDLIDTMYTNIIRKVNKAYKYVQQRSDFVWKESKKILLLKDKAREDKRKMSELWEEILQCSSLAASMQDLYETISHNKIAALQLDTDEGTITHSVQIPVPFHIADLPPLDREDDSRGLWITTANSFVGDNNAIEEPDFLDKNFALLLMGDDKKISAELSSDPDETTLSMIEFVRHSKPTISFHQVAQQTNNILTLDQVRKYAQHFIFWRRAIAIPPLHARDVYVLSPNADMATLPRATAVWARQFPFAPALPNFLSDLSAAPKPYKWFCPSKSLRMDYLAMLAWLLCGGWVTQLCTFAYVIVWPEIIYEVDYALEAEEVARAKKAQAVATDELQHVPAEKEPTSSLRKERKRRGSAGSGVPSSVADLASSTSTLQRTVSVATANTNTTTSSLSPSPSSPSPSSLTASRPHSQPTLAERIAEKARLERIADKAARELAEKATAHARKVYPKPTDHPSLNNAPHLAGLSPYVVLDARKATGKESLYLSAIGKRLRQRRTQPVAKSKKDGGASSSAAAAAAAAAAAKAKDGKGKGVARGGVVGGGAGGGLENWDAKVAYYWPLFLKYFNGRSALERIALQEEMKRKEVWNLLTAMSEYLLCVRHW